MTTIGVPVRGFGKKTRLGLVKVEMTAIAADGRRDHDRLVLRCTPSLGPCDECLGNPGGPDELDVSTLDSGTDFDIGWTGTSHNFTLPPRSGLKLCLSGCDASTDPLCDVSTTPVGTGTTNPMFGPPLPLIAQGVPVCVVNRYQHAPTGNAVPPAPVWPDPTHPKTSSGTTLVATFCAGATGGPVVNGTIGLPGPGAIVLPITETLLKLPD